jgi:hypothetical protein
MIARWQARPGTVERAFQIAGSVQIDTIEDIARQLGKKGYDRVADHLAGPLIRKQLRDVCGSATTRKRRRARSALGAAHHSICTSKSVSDACG